MPRPAELLLDLLTVHQAARPLSPPRANTTTMTDHPASKPEWMETSHSVPNPTHSSMSHLHPSDHAPNLHTKYEKNHGADPHLQKTTHIGLFESDKSPLNSES